VTRFFEVLIYNTAKIDQTFSEFKIGRSQGISIKELVGVFEKKANIIRVVWTIRNLPPFIALQNVK